MIHWWENLTFLHWSFDPITVARLLPDGLEPETWDGKAWVALVPFHMRVALPHTPPIPWLTTFPETNVRTYVRDRTGRTGVWFFSLEAARLSVVATARTTYRIPYFWSKMRISEDAAGTTYETNRRWPGPRGASSIVRVQPGDPFLPAELTSFDHWLTSRWILFSVRGTRQRYAEAWHEPWPLFKATITDLDDQLIEAAGLPAPTGDPIVHYSPGVKVRIGKPRRIGDEGNITAKNLRRDVLERRADVDERTGNRFRYFG